MIVSFSVDENNETTVHKFEGYDDTQDQMVRELAQGAGVILACVTLSSLKEASKTTAAVYGTSRNGLTLNQAVYIQKDSRFPPH
ncbi:hypothetical protein [Corynebacterium rouxii]|uniref:hypothetical protein n=1 Tax=Corynebacterium rouxii TaxID=2719119 RepID=UPI00313CFB23